MKAEEVKNAVVRALCEVQTSSGRPSPRITGSTCPLTDLEGFDSLNAVETSALVSEYLGHDIDSNIVLATHYGQPLTVSEIVDKVYESIKTI